MANKLFTFRLPLREPSSPSLLSVSPSPTEQIPQQLTNCMNYLSLVTTHPSERMWNSDFAVPPPPGLRPLFMMCGFYYLGVMGSAFQVPNIRGNTGLETRIPIISMQRTLYNTWLT